MTSVHPQPERFGLGADPAELPHCARTYGEGGGTMTQQHEVEIQYVGGPFDGQYVTVSVDVVTNEPPQYPTTQSLGPADFRINLVTGPIADIVSQLYELDTLLGPDGVAWIYRFTGETRMRPAA